MQERLIAVLIDICGFALIFLAGAFIYRLMSPFICFRKGRLTRILLLLLYSGSCGMVIWIGDPNVLYTMLVFFPCFFLITRGATSPATGPGHDIFLLYHVCLRNY